MNVRQTRSKAKANLNQQHNCAKCGRPDDVDRYMVQCDKCNHWYHFSCAGVDSSIADRSYYCDACDVVQSTLRNSSKSVCDSSSSLSRVNLSLELQKLEAEKRLEQQQQQLNIEKSFLEKKFSMLKASLQEEGDDISVRSRRSCRSRSSRIQKWIQTQCLSDPGTTFVPKVAVAVGINEDSRATFTSSATKGNLATAAPVTTRDEGENRGDPVNDSEPCSAAAKAVTSTPQSTVGDVTTSPWRNNTSNESRIQSQGAIPKQPAPEAFLPQCTIALPQRNAATLGNSQVTAATVSNVHSVGIHRAAVSNYIMPTRPHFISNPINEPPLSINKYRSDIPINDKYSPVSLAMPLPGPKCTEYNSTLLNHASYINFPVNRSIFNPSDGGIISSNLSRSIPPVREYGQHVVQQKGKLIIDTQVKGQSFNREVNENRSTHIVSEVRQPVVPAENYPAVTVQSVPVLGGDSRNHLLTYPSVSTQQPIMSAEEYPSTEHQPMYNISQQQLSARHVVPKELPVFAGDPAEWPLFFSSYNNSTLMCGFTDAENLMRLQRCLKGSAREAVSSLLLHPSSVPRILSSLQTLFGRPEQMVSSLLSKIRATPAPKADKLDSMVSFGLAVQNFCELLRAVGLEAHLSNPNLMQELVDKLPANIKLNWALYIGQQSKVDLGVFGDFIASIVAAASSVTSTTANEKKPYWKDERKPKDKAYVHAHAATSGNSEAIQQTGFKKARADKQCVVCGKIGHNVRECFSFKNMSVEDRWKAVRQHRLCRRCLGTHGRWPCKADVCGVERCSENHHRLLHLREQRSLEIPTTGSNTVSLHHLSFNSTLFRVIPVTLHGKSRSIETFAFLDDGSSITMMEQGLADQLDERGRPDKLRLQWTGGVTKVMNDSQVLQLRISGSNMQKQHALNDVYTVHNLDLPVQSYCHEIMAKKHSHLRGIPVESYQQATPRVLIGLNNIKLLTSLKLREGRKEEPVASKTRLGWTVYGGNSLGTVQPMHRTLHVSTSPNEELNMLIKQYFSIESFGVAIVPAAEGDEDKRARTIMEQTTVRTLSGRFETGLLWRHDYVEFPDSRPAAVKRLICLERKLIKSSILYENVRQQIIQYQDKGYAHKATIDELERFDPRRTWYLPLGVALNPRKPEKVRIIWDAAAKVNGVSLNSKLMKGPDLLASLTAVLFLFRQRQVAVTGDIREMFHQVYIRQHDRQSQLFLWRDEPTKPIETFVMDVATFGCTCSPSSVQYIKNLNAEDHRDQYPEAVNAIIKNHYVDDYLDSLDTPEEAIQLISQVKEVHQKAGFEIRNWLSSSEEVLRRVGEPYPVSTKCFVIGKEEGMERILGIVWTPSSDVFSFAIEFRPDVQVIVESYEIPTKRQVLKAVMSIFDPLGLIALVTIHGKVLVQELWRQKVDWDDCIPENMYGKWKRWIDIVKDLRKVDVPRCYFQNYDPCSYDSLEMHIFVDASELAYTALAYFRIIDRGIVRMALVAAKSKVAPLQALSIPRLELQAAVLGVRLSKTIVQHHSIPVQRRVFWSDSSTVLSWIGADQRRYRPFVAFRINEILAESTEEEWRWVPTRWNIADEGTKWTKTPDLSSQSRWFKGPEFLYEEESSWPQQKPVMPESSEELRPIHLHNQLVTEPLIDFNRFSKWERLLGTAKYVHRFLWKAKQSSSNETSTRKELQAAERIVWKQVQNDEFSDEIVILKRNLELRSGKQQSQLPKSSRIFKLSPCLDEYGVLRSESRLESATFMSYDQGFMRDFFH